MKLTIEQLSKLTKLSIPTLRVYVSRQKLGTKAGNKRVYSQTDVQKLLKASKKSPAKRSAVAKKHALTSKKTIKSKSISAKAAKITPSVQVRNVPILKSTKVSIWTRLFGGGKQKQKVRLLDSKITK